MSDHSALIRAMDEYGSAMRGDWSDFDGRSLRAVINDWTAELAGLKEPISIEQHRAGLGLCPDGGGHWGGKWGHCADHGCPTYAKEVP